MSDFKTVPEGYTLTLTTPTFDQLDKVLADLGTPNPKVSEQWLREFYTAMLKEGSISNE